MGLVKTAAQLFISKLEDGGSGLNLDSVVSGLQSLLPTSDGDLDLGSLAEKFASNGGSLASIAASWLGDDGNDGLDVGSIMSLFGESEVSQFAESLGLSPDQAASGLSQMIPDLIDKGSEGGNLMGSAGPKLASNLLSKLF